MMVVPTKQEIEKKQKQLQDFLKKIDPKTGLSKEKDMVNVVRSAIRKAWMRSPTKLAYLSMHTVPDMDGTTRTKWKVQCEICKEWFKLPEIEIDHVIGNHSFNKLEDFENYFNNILMVGFDGLQAICKEDHAIKTLSEKLDISFESARIEKAVIEIMKSKKEKDFLKEHGVTPASNSASRREQVRHVLTKEKKNDAKLD